MNCLNSLNKKNLKKFFISALFLSSIFISGCANNTDNYTSNDTNKVTEFGDIEVSKNDENSNNTNNISNHENLDLFFLDVGQADCSFIKLPNGENILIDAGNNSDGDNIINFIESKNINKIDILIGTHPHADHIGGMDDIINHFNVGNIYMPKIPKEYVPTTKTYKDVLSAIKEKGLKITSPNQNDIIYNKDNIKITVLSDINKINTKDLNAYSIVLKIDYFDNSFIFTGDADKEVEDIILNTIDKNLLSADLLKVGHHGSSTASSINFVKTINPKITIISCGKGNTYGHPHKEVLDLLNNLNIKFYRTDELGTIHFISNGNDITLE